MPFRKKPVVIFHILLLSSMLCLLVACSPRSPDVKALIEYAQAKADYELGNAVDAAKILASLCKEWPDFHQAAFVRARVLYFTASYGEAEKAFRKPICDHPNHLEAALWLVRCLQAKKNRPELRLPLEHLISVNPDYSRILWFMALQPEAENRFDQAMG